jgi:hypothetical protein
VQFFKMDKVDSNKDKMVSKKEFLDAMSKSWDTHMADVKKTEGDKMGADKAVAAMGVSGCGGRICAGGACCPELAHPASSSQGFDGVSARRR